MTAQRPPDRAGHITVVRQASGRAGGLRTAAARRTELAPHRAFAREWREANRAKFDAMEADGLFAPDLASSVHRGSSLKNSRAYARWWRDATKPHFDALEADGAYR